MSLCSIEQIKIKIYTLNGTVEHQLGDSELIVTSAFNPPSKEQIKHLEHLGVKKLHLIKELMDDDEIRFSLPRNLTHLKCDFAVDIQQINKKQQPYLQECEVVIRKWSNINSADACISADLSQMKKIELISGDKITDYHLMTAAKEIVISLNVTFKPTENISLCESLTVKNDNILQQLIRSNYQLNELVINLLTPTDITYALNWIRSHVRHLVISNEVTFSYKWNGQNCPQILQSFGFIAWWREPLKHTNIQQMIEFLRVDHFTFRQEFKTGFNIPAFEIRVKLLHSIWIMNTSNTIT